MRRESTGSKNWTTLLIVFIAALLARAFAYPIEVRILPLVVGLPTLFLLLILRIGSFHPGLNRWIDRVFRRSETGAKDSGKPGKSQDFTGWRPVLIIMAWIFSYFVLVFFFGFALVSPFFIAAFLIRKAEMRWTSSMACAILGTVLVYLFMEGVIHADLWTGAIPEIIPGFLGGDIIPPL